MEEELRDLRPNDTIATVLARAVAERPALAAVLPRCSYLLDAIASADPQRTVDDVGILDVLPPFAGG
ncbi:MoaD/ThiS family protein [Rhodococcus sp. 14-2496-1d]|uniref:MoaD/ThiS family protein n=1 Tax=Rhodococcus sp. 14-2496-1d TaxID=2023146 RepID=UPI00211ACF6C|nr:MoaD/ThiS family protein [Rhodococcus sp. 14-2496-1d]